MGLLYPLAPAPLSACVTTNCPINILCKFLARSPELAADTRMHEPCEAPSLPARHRSRRHHGDIIIVIMGCGQSTPGNDKQHLRVLLWLRHARGQLLSEPKSDQRFSKKYIFSGGTQ